MVALGTFGFFSHVLLTVGSGHLHHLLRLCYWRTVVRRSTVVRLVLLAMVRWLYGRRATHRRRWSLSELHWVWWRLAVGVLRLRGRLLRWRLAVEVLRLWARWLRRVLSLQDLRGMKTVVRRRLVLWSLLRWLRGWPLQNLCRSGQLLVLMLRLHRTCRANSKHIPQTLTLPLVILLDRRRRSALSTHHGLDLLQTHHLPPSRAV